jgi:hypothetical protein
MHQPANRPQLWASGGGRAPSEAAQAAGVWTGNGTLTAGRSNVAVCRSSASKAAENVAPGITTCRTDGEQTGEHGWVCRHRRAGTKRKACELSRALTAAVSLAAVDDAAGLLALRHDRRGGLFGRGARRG